MSLSPLRLLFCDYDGKFRFGDVLSQVGFIVDQIRPEALRQVSVGDHELYLFAFSEIEDQKKALKTCEKLKSAELSIPLLLVSWTPASPEFFNHKTSKFPANGYLANPESRSAILDLLDQVIGVPIPANLKGTMQIISEDKAALEAERQKVLELEQRIQEMEGSHANLDKALEVQRNYYKPKLKAMLEEQSKTVQTETESLKFKLSEVEAKLLDREMKIKDLEGQQEKALQKLREFYQGKLKALEGKLKEVPDSTKKTSEA